MDFGILQSVSQPMDSILQQKIQKLQMKADRLNGVRF
jgi:hypothetical protein